MANRMTSAHFVGRSAQLTELEAALRDARPQSQNGFKVELAKRCLIHALRTAAAA